MTEDPFHIVAWQRLDGTTTTSGMLAAQNVPELAALGVRHVINLALADSPGALANEAGLLDAAGIAFTHIPVPFSAPEKSHFLAFCDALEHGPRPVHVHCIMNWRVSAFFYRYHREVCCMPDAEARALLDQQWTPEDSDHADAPAWAQFIGGE